MDRKPYYFALLIFTLLTFSSLYLSWSADTGNGELVVERFQVERAPGRPVDFMVYRPRDTTYGSPLPIVLSIHGVAGSKEGMFSFNIELARRNFTVVSVDLPGHGDSDLSFDISDISGMADDCYFAVRHVQTTFDGVDNETYGVLTHSLGFQIALELADYPVAPSAYTTVGYIGESDLLSASEFPGNLMIALGQFDEMIPTEDALDALQAMTGNESAEAGITYGSFDNQTAYRLSFAPTDHVFAAIDNNLVKSSTIWMIEALQGVEQLEHTLSIDNQVFANKTIGMTVGSVGVLLSIIPLLLILQSFAHEKLNLLKYENKLDAMPLKKTAILGSLLGVITVVLFSASAVIGFQLELLGHYFPNSMFATGLVVFPVLFIFVGPLLLLVIVGRERTSEMFHTLGIKFDEWKKHLPGFIVSLGIAAVCIAWMLFLLSFTGSAELMTTWNVLYLIRLPVHERWLNTFAVMIVSVPFFIIDTAWIRGLLLTKREWSEKNYQTKIMFFGFAIRMAASSAVAAFIVFLTTLLGFIVGAMVLLGLLLLLFMITSILTTILISKTTLEFENPWAAIVLSAFLWGIVAISAIPLI